MLPESGYKVDDKSPKMSNYLITKSDLEPILDIHTGNKLFFRALDEATDGAMLISFLGQYTHFNSVFGAGVASLSGEIARRQDLFRNREQPVEILAEQSIEVAARIFYAAVEEFHRHKTHRAMAKDSIQEIGSYFGLTSLDMNRLMPAKRSTLSFMEKITDGYCPSRAGDEAEVHAAIGFHIASEIIADEEFNILDRHLRTKHIDLVEHLKQKKAYAWVQVHTTVEADHFEIAVEGANCALNYYAGQLELSQVKSLILKGFTQFADLQTEFMESLCSKNLSANVI